MGVMSKCWACDNLASDWCSFCDYCIKAMRFNLFGGQIKYPKNYEYVVGVDFGAGADKTAVVLKNADTGDLRVVVG